MRKPERDILEVNRAIAGAEAILRQHGLVARTSLNFRKLKKALKSLPEKNISAQADAQFFDFKSVRGLWVGVYDADDRCVSIQAARLDDIQDAVLADHWKDQQPRIYEGGRLGKMHAPLAYEMSGRIVYHGDLWLSDVLRGKGLSIPICRIGYFTALLKLDPDYIYAFMSRALVRKHLHRDYGCSYAAGYGTHWIEPPQGIDPSDCLIAASSDDLHHYAMELNLDNG